MGRRKSKIIASPRLRSERLSQGWIARDFAHRIGISRSALSAIELRKSGVSERTAVAIASLLHREFDELFEVIPAHNASPDEDAVHAG